MTKGRVESLYKKGNPRQESNYRPISLLKTTYKLYATIIRNRIASVIDDLFSPKRNVASGNPAAQLMLFIYSEELVTSLDWEKAFDRVYHGKLIESLDRLRIPEKSRKL